MSSLINLKKKNHFFLELSFPLYSVNKNVVEWCEFLGYFLSFLITPIWRITRTNKRLLFLIPYQHVEYPILYLLLQIISMEFGYINLIALPIAPVVFPCTETVYGHKATILTNNTLYASLYILQHSKISI